MRTRFPKRFTSSILPSIPGTPVFGTSISISLVSCRGILCPERVVERDHAQRGRVQERSALWRSGLPGCRDIRAERLNVHPIARTRTRGFAP